MTRQRALHIALAVLAIAYATSHVAALFTDAVNWDEFAQLHRASETIATGTLKGGGRPGLVVLPLLPLVRDCSHVMEVAHVTRLLWTLATFALLAGLFVLMRRVTRRSPWSLHAAALATASLALVPLFLRWSLQVRTDQPAIAAILWAGVALFAARRRWWLVAGALAAIGYLSSQKAIYVLALVGVLHAGDLYIAGTIEWRRELRRAAWMLVGALATYVAFQIVVRLAFEPPNQTSLDKGLDLFRWYRLVLKFRLYRDIVPAVVPHIGLLVLVLCAAVRSFRRDTPERKSLLVALVVVLLGIGVGRFHTASFPYFWMTIGLFPACAIALGLGGIRELVRGAFPFVLGAAWLVMLALGVRYRSETLVDTQAVQRETFAFVEGLPPTWRGFNGDGGLICRRDPDPFPVFLGQHITLRFGGEKGTQYTEQFLAEHRTRPIQFLVRSNRVTFPSPVREFWAAHYVPYRGSAWLAGWQITGAADTRVDVDVIAPGRYRWHTMYGASLDVDGTVLAPGDRLELAAGPHATRLLGASGDGKLVLDVGVPAWPDVTGFYPSSAIAELSGIRGRWW